MNLFLTKLDCKIDSEKKKIFLGRWCLAHEIDTDKYGKFETLNYHWDDNKKINEDYKYLYDLYYKVLNLLSKKLNKIHNLENNLRFWHVLTGAWLYKFLIQSYDKWECIKQALIKFPISRIYYYKFETKDIISSDITDLHKLSNNHIWQNNFFTLIAKQQAKTNVKFIQLKQPVKKKQKFILNKYTKQTNFTLQKLDKFLSIIQKNPKVTLYKTYFKKNNNLKIFLKSLTIPRLYSEFELQKELPEPMNRDKLVLEFNSNINFENFVKENIFKFMPISYLEGFNVVNEISKKIDLNPKTIISAVGEENDLFSLWAANKINNGSSYLFSEHGGNIEDCPKFDSCLSKFDRFLSWNYSFKKNVKQIAPQFYNKKLARKDLNLGEKLYVILSTPNLYNHRLHYDLKSDQFIYEYEKLKSLKKLSPYIYNNLKFRLHPNSFRWAMKERIKQDFDNNKICSITKIENIFKKSKIVLNMDFQTSFYQSMFSGKPNIVFTSRKLIESINPKIKALYEKFIEEKIIVTDTNDLNKHINSIWDNPYEWWHKKSLIKLRKDFNYLCSKETNNFSTEILQIINNYEN